MGDLKSLEADVNIMLANFMVTSKKGSLLKGAASQFIIEDFGLIVCCINRLDYAQIKDVINNQYPNWRVTFITTSDNILEKKYDVLWDLMRCGYMKWLRNAYPRQIKRVLTGPDNLGTMIIQERLKLWNDQPKFKYLIEDNKIALKNGVTAELNNDPSFFDYLPGKEND